MTRATSPRLGWRWGARPVALSYAAVDDWAVVDSTNAQLSRGSAEPIPQLSLSGTRELMIASGRLYYPVQLRNFLREPVTTTASLAVASDFADMFEVRGGVRRSARHALAPKRTGRGLVLAYVGEDQVFRDAIIELSPAPDELDLGTGQARGRWEVTLQPGKPVEILMTVEPSIGGVGVGDGDARGQPRIWSARAPIGSHRARRSGVTASCSTA